MKLGELKEAIKDLPDDLEVVLNGYDQDGYSYEYELTNHKASIYSILPSKLYLIGEQ